MFQLGKDAQTTTKSEGKDTQKTTPLHSAKAPRVLQALLNTDLKFRNPRYVDNYLTGFL